MLLFASRAQCEGEITIGRREAWTSVFGGQEVTVHWQATSQRPAKGRLHWSLSAPERLSVGHGELPIDLPPGVAADVAAKISIPAVKEGAVLPLQLSASIEVDGQRQQQSHLDERLWVFHRDPFVGRQRWLADLKIALFDPDGATAAKLADANVSVEQVHSSAALEEHSFGFILIGEGVSFREERALGDILRQNAARGIPVLCLAPAGGELSLASTTGDDGNSKLAVELSFRRHHFIRQLDKRLDDRYWMSHAVAPQRTIELVGDGPQAAVASFVDARHGWQWIEWQFPPTAPNARGASLIVACPQIIQHWDEGPTPRYLFARLLESMTGSSPPDSVKVNEANQQTAKEHTANTKTGRKETIR